MGTAMILKIILADGTSQRLTLSGGPPASIDDLTDEVRKQCGLHGNFKLQFMDALFGNKFLNLTSISEVENKGILKVIATVQHMDEESTVNLVSESQAFTPSPVGDCSYLSGVSVDTDVMSSSELVSSRSLWPAVFHVPTFSFDSELKLQHANMAYIKNGTTLIPDPKLKSAILESLVQEIMKYKVYANDKEMHEVAQSLIKKRPCLTEKGSG